jgi:hypothetical protein
MHEFSHTVENMTMYGTQRIRHGFYPENRNRFPDWQEAGEADFYYWFSRHHIHEIFKQAGKPESWRDLTFIQ